MNHAECVGCYYCVWGGVYDPNFVLPVDSCPEASEDQLKNKLKAQTMIGERLCE